MQLCTAVGSAARHCVGLVAPATVLPSTTFFMFFACTSLSDFSSPACHWLSEIVPDAPWPVAAWLVNASVTTTSDGFIRLMVLITTERKTSHEP